MSDVVCRTCGRSYQVWRAGDKPIKCICGHFAFSTWRTTIRHWVRGMKH